MKRFIMGAMSVMLFALVFFVGAIRPQRARSNDKKNAN